MRRLFRAALLAAAALTPRLAHAVPAFAGQTGQPCSACHIGAFGPELTPFGRYFKIGGYTQSGGTGLASQIPLSAMTLSSFTHTAKNQTFPAATHYGTNDNIAMDQISVFLAGHVGDHVGGLVQGTFNGIDSSTFLDNTDVRLTDQGQVLGQFATYGLSLNNSPGLADPWNSTEPWGYHFAASALSVGPSAQSVLEGSLAGNSLGLTAYAWLDNKFYLEGGLYETMAPSLLHTLGQTYSLGSATAPMPYVRAAYEYDWGINNAHIGGTFFYGRFNPSIASYSVIGSLGHDNYTDWLIDAGYQWLPQNQSFTLNAHYDYQIDDLRGSTALGGASQNHNWLSESAVTATYYWHNTYGATINWSTLQGRADPLLYPGGTPDFGSANGKPDTNAFTMEADYIPFGKIDSAFRPFANLKIGLQYIVYTRFDGGTNNYDGFGRNAGDNNVLYLYLWTIW